MKILLFGGSGQLGSAIIRAVEADKSELAVAAPSHQSADVTSYDHVFGYANIVKPDVIINSAAWTDVNGCEKNHERSHGVNASGAHNVAVAAREVGAFLIHISSDSCEQPPRGEYAKAKQMAEQHVTRVMESNSVILRLSCILSTHRNGWLSYVVRSAMKGLRPKVSCQIMAPVTMPTLTEAILTCAVQKTTGIYSVSDGPPVSRYCLATEAIRLMGSRLLVEEAAPSGGGAPRRIDSIMTTPQIGPQQYLWRSWLPQAIEDITRQEVVDVG